MQLDGIPISDEQCIGESLPILNTSFQTLCAFANNSYTTITTLQDRVGVLESAIVKSDRILNSQLRISEYGAIGIGLAPIGSDFLRVAGPARFEGSILAAEAIITGPTTLNTLLARSTMTLSGDAIIGSTSSQNFTVNSSTKFNGNVGIKTDPDGTNALKVNGSAVFTSVSAGNYLGITNANISFDNVTQLKTIGSLAVTSLTAGIGYQTPTANIGTATRNTNYSTTGLLKYEITLNSSCGSIKLPAQTFVGNTPVFITVTNSTIKETDVIVTNVRTSSLTYCTASIVGISDGSFIIIVQSTGANIGDGLYPQITINFARITTTA